MFQSYFLVINGRPEGPFSMAQLKELNIRPGDFVKTPEMDDYKEAHEIAGLRELMGFKREALIPQYFASFDQRLLASALDWFFVSGACILVVFVLVLFTTDKATRLAVSLGLLLVIPVSKLIYQITLEASVKQATFGKQILHIKVCDMRGERISFPHATGRSFAKIFSVLTFFIGYLFSFFNKQQQCLHDMIAGTLVMKDRLF